MAQRVRAHLLEGALGLGVDSADSIEHVARGLVFVLVERARGVRGADYRGDGGVDDAVVLERQLLLLLQLGWDADQALELAIVADAEHGNLRLAAREGHVELAVDFDDGCLGVVEGCARLSHACEPPVASERSTLEVVLVVLRPLPRGHRRAPTLSA
jgi:hypothetical protein